MTQIKNIFEKDIFRSINGVIKADDLTESSRWQELEEYVVTKELDKHFRKFFDAYLESIDNENNPDIASKIGIWVSGFFGSGKSHFIKILSYLLENKPVTKDGVSRAPVDFFKEKISDAALYGDIKRAVTNAPDVILFNIDSKADSSKTRDAILSVFLRVFNEKMGYSGDYPYIAHMERFLDKEGKLKDFHDHFKTLTGKTWTDHRDSAAFFNGEVAKSFSQASGLSVEAAQKWLDEADEKFPLTIENFSKWVREYLDSKGPKHRIIFLVDEVGQFIGDDTHLMLNLQTIVEELGTHCMGRAWVAVTSQEDIDAVIGEVKASKSNDFSKITGRFKTRMSLSSSNTDEVIQKRLLEKKPEFEKKLQSLYAEKGTILRSQLGFNNIGTTYKEIRDENDFILNYPFAPYQFQLVQRIFESIRRVGATGLHLSRGERSMLDAFQIAGQESASDELGALVPLHKFYKPIESFLDTSVKRAIDNAGENKTLQGFDIEVLKTLFLVRYVDEFRANVENLVTLFISKVDDDRIELKKKIEASLQRLESQTLINVSGENYFFLTDQERDISREIKATDLASGEETKQLGILVFEEALKNLRKHTFSKSQKVFDLNRLCDLAPVGHVQTDALVISVITPLCDQYDFYKTDGQCINQSTAEGGQVLIRLPEDKKLADDLRTYLKTDKYIRKKNDGSIPTTTQDILRQRQQENSQRYDRLIHDMERLLNESVYYVNGQKFQPSSSTASLAVAEAFENLIENTFTKLSCMTHYCSGDIQREIQAVLKMDDTTVLDLEGGEANPRAIEEVIQRIANLHAASRQINVEDLIKTFARRPYGWPEYETFLILSKLVVAGEISFMSDGDIMPRNKIADIVSTPRKWSAVKIMPRKRLDGGILARVRKTANDIFGQQAPDKEEALFHFLDKKLAEWDDILRNYIILSSTGRYPGHTEIEASLSLIKKLRHDKDSFLFLQRFLEEQENLKTLEENFHELKHFYDSQRGIWDNLLQALERFLPNQYVLGKNAESTAAMTRLLEIRQMSKPYQAIREIDDLIRKTETVNKDELKKAREQASDSIDQRIEHIKNELGRVNASEDLRSTCLYSLEALKDHLGSETSISAILQAPASADDIVLESMIAIQMAQTTGKKTGTTGGLSEPAAAGYSSDSVVKIVEPVRVADIAPKAFLETEQDVNDFIKELEKKLKDVIARNRRIQIR